MGRTGGRRSNYLPSCSWQLLVVCKLHFSYKALKAGPTASANPGHSSGHTPLMYEGAINSLHLSSFHKCDILILNSESKWLMIEGETVKATKSSDYLGSSKLFTVILYGDALSLRSRVCSYDLLCYDAARKESLNQYFPLFRPSDTLRPVLPPLCTYRKTASSSVRKADSLP